MLACGARTELALDADGSTSASAGEMEGISAACEPGTPGGEGPTPIASSDILAGAFALGGGYAWLAEWTFTGGVYRIPLAGGAEQLLADGRTNPEAVEALGTTAFWIDTGLHCGNGTLSRIDASGRVSQLGAGLERPNDLALHGGFVYVGDGPEGPCRNPGRLLRFEATTGKQEVLLDDLLRVTAVVSVGDDIVFGDAEGRVVLASSMLTSTPSTQLLVRAPERIGRLAVHGSTVYWTAGNQLGRVSIDSPSPTVLLKDQCVQGLAADDDGVFFTCRDFNDPEAPGLFHLDPSTRTIRRLHSGSHNLTQVRTDDRRIYWLDLANAGGSLWTVCKSAVGI